MKNAHDVIIRALVSEKGSRLREGGNKFLFEVARDANKIEIKRAVEEVFEVTVEEVRTQMVPGKVKRLGAHAGRRPEWKKAIVTLSQGDTIELFDQI